MVLPHTPQICDGVSRNPIILWRYFLIPGKSFVSNPPNFAKKKSIFIWLEVTGFLGTPWFAAKCIWRPLIPSQMHLATIDPQPNAFGDHWSPAKCIWRPFARKWPIHEQLIVFLHHIAGKSRLHLRSQPAPAAHHIMQMDVLLFAQLAHFSGGKWKTKFQNFKHILVTSCWWCENMMEI